MKLLLTTDAVGGVWTYARTLAEALATEGVDVTVALIGPGDPDARDLTVVRVPGTLDWLADDAGQVLATGAMLADLARTEGADIVQLNTPAWRAGVDWPVPVVAVAHSCVGTWWQACRRGPLPADQEWRATLHAEGLRRADVTVAPTAAHAAATAALYRVQAPVVVANGRALPLPAPSAHAPFRTAFSAGRLWDEGKGMDVLDEAAAVTATPVRAAGATAGPAGGRIGFRHIQSLGVLSGAALGAELAARPIFVSPARYEPFGLAILEAAGAGCPLVLADIPSLRELWHDAALFVAPGDAAGFAAAIDALAADPAAAALWGARARGRASRYTPDTQAALMLGLYRAALTKAQMVPA